MNLHQVLKLELSSDVILVLSVDVDVHLSDVFVLPTDELSVFYDVPPHTVLVSDVVFL